MKDTLPRMVPRQCERFKGRAAMRRKLAGQYRDISWSPFAEKIETYTRARMPLASRVTSRRLPWRLTDRSGPGPISAS